MRFYEGGYINERRIIYGNRIACTRPLFKLIELYKLMVENRLIQTGQDGFSFT